MAMKRFNVSWEQKSKSDTCAPSHMRRLVSANSSSEAISKIRSEPVNSNIIRKNFNAVESR